MNQGPDRWEEIQQLHSDNRGFFQILIGATLIGFGVVIGATAFGDDSGYIVNLFTEVLSLAVTVFVLDLLARQREERNLKRRLIQQLGSNFNVVALTALEELWLRGWTQDGSLAGINLSRADLRGADFGKANLTGVQFASRRYGQARLDEHTRLPDETFWNEAYDISYLERFTRPDHPDYWRGFGLHKGNLARENFAGANLYGADLYGANLWYANLSGARLQNAILQHSRMRQANLSGADLRNAEMDHADLRQADLSGADLADADLQGVDLEGATLTGANLAGARLLDARLPNGEKYLSGLDLSEFGIRGKPSDDPAKFAFSP